jgi:hypothetical protein
MKRKQKSASRRRGKILSIDSYSLMGDPFTGERSVFPADQREVCGAFDHTVLAGGVTKGV